MKKLILIICVVAAFSLFAMPALAADPMTCAHTSTTIVSLRDCVKHAYDMGHITNKGIANSLIAKLDAAQAALDRGQPDVASELLNAFINEVNAQSGQHIAADHAAHMVMHAHMVIAALGG